MPDNEERLVERHRNALLRPIDWRFLLDGEERPRASVQAGAGVADGARLAFAPEGPDRAPDLVVGGFPGAGFAAGAFEQLRPGGEVACSWRMPRPGAVRRAVRRLERAGFEDVRAYWAGPLPYRQPQFWLRLEEPAAAAHLLAGRPARSGAGAILRRLWPYVERAGMLAPVCVIGRRPPGREVAEGRSGPRLGTLLTGGKRTINKVVGLVFDGGSPRPAAVVKIARVEEAEEGLAREAAMLRLLGERGAAGFRGAPRLRGEGRRGGMLAVEESPVEGGSLMDDLTSDSFAERAAGVTDLLVELAGEAPPAPEEEWRQRLVEEPLRRFDRDFGPVLAPGTGEAAERLLGRIGSMPLVPEHRDCSPWNVVLTGKGEPALLDWESAEASGLPGLDLTYFLANCAFVLDRALESGRTRQSYSGLLDPGTPHGRIAAEEFGRYAAALGIDPASLPGLRLLCWIVHSRSDHRHLQLEAAGGPSRQALRSSVFAGLVEEELRLAGQLG